MRKFGLACVALLPATSLQAKWIEAESPNFKAYSDGSQKELLNNLTRLEGVHQLLGIATGVPGNTKSVKVKIYYVADISAVQRMAGRDGSDVAGFYNPETLGAYAVVPRFSGNSGSFSSERVLFHEYTHHYMLQYMKGAFPGWFIEGFAEVFSTASFEKKGAITFGKAAMHRESELRYGKWLPYPAIFDGSYRKRKDLDGAAFYGQSWLAAHYLLLSGNRQGQLRQYMAAIQRGTPMDKAPEVFGNVNELSKELRVYYDRASFPYKTPPLQEIKASSITFRDLRPGEAALLEDRIKLQIFADIPADDDLSEGESKEQHAVHISDAKKRRDVWLLPLRKKVAALGHDPDAIELLAEAECRSGNKPECVAAVDKFLAIAPNNPRALTLKAESIGKGDAALALLVKAIKIDPDNPQAKVAYYQTFINEGNSPPDDALGALFQAMQMMPQVDSWRLKLGQALAASGDKEKAIAALTPLAFAAHSSSSQKKAAALIVKLKGEPSS